MKYRALLLLFVCTLLSGCTYTQITIKSPESQSGPTVGEIKVDSDVGYKGNAGSNGSTSEAGGATLQPTVRP